MNYTQMTCGQLSGDSVVISGRDRDIILDELVSRYTPTQYTSRNGWEVFYRTFMPIYIDAILNKKYAPYKPGASNEIVPYMTQKTGTKLGFSTAFIYILYELANDGRIETYIWNPALYDTVKASRPKGPFDDTFEAIGAGLLSGVKSGFSQILFAGAVVGVIYLLGKSVIAKKL